MSKIKRLAAFVVSVCMLGSVGLMAACGGNDDTHTEHRDENGDGLCDIGGEPWTDPNPDTEPDVTTLTINRTNVSLVVGDAMTLVATAPEDSTVTWSSSNPSVVSVTSDGRVTALADGTATITATDGTLSDTCTVVAGTSFTYKASYSADPTTWNPHTWENNTDSIILGYITTGFYDVELVYDEAGNAVDYEWTTEMAAAFPEDVTSQYAGTYGISSGDERKAWRIELNEDAKWQDGTAITADDYVYSMQQQLDPQMFNRRSDSYTSSTFSIYGARNYLYSLTESTYETVGSQGYDTNAEAIAAGETLYIDMWNLWNLEGMVDAAGNECPQWVEITDTTEYRDLATEAGEDGDWISAADIWEGNSALLEVGGDYESCVSILVNNDHLDYTWEYNSNGNGGVGVVKVDDYTIDIILNNEISDFYIKYNLTGNWLVNEELYEAGKTTVGDTVQTNYCTTLATTASYGPYVLSSYASGQYFVLERNENWYGYTDGQHEGQYTTTVIDYTYLESGTAKETSREMFMMGDLSDYSLDGTEMATYGNSSYVVSVPESYTYQFFLATEASQDYLNSESSEGENHAVLGLTTFRKALSYAFDREAYVSRFQPTAEPGFGILNYLYIYDPDTGAVYRESEQAMRTILLAQDFYEENGVWYDVHGTAYGDLEAAYDAVTGYDLAYAADLFEDAYAEAVSEGYIAQYGADVVLTYNSVGNASENTNAFIAMMNQWFAAALEACDEPTFNSITVEFHGHANESSYWEALKAGRMDISFSAWGGSAMDTWGIIYSCYVNPDNTNNYGFDSLAKSIDVTVEYDGDEYTYSLYDWTMWLYNGQSDDMYDSDNLYEIFGSLDDASAEFKLEVFSACELAQLQTYANLPIFYSYVMSLRSAQYNNGSTTYINNMIGYGGIRHINYNYSDTQWSAFVAEHNGNLEDFYTAS